MGHPWLMRITPYVLLCRPGHETALRDYANDVRRTQHGTAREDLNAGEVGGPWAMICIWTTRR